LNSLWLIILPVFTEVRSPLRIFTLSRIFLKRLFGKINAFASLRK
jgi:hypothetical protein